MSEKDLVGDIEDMNDYNKAVLIMWHKHWVWYYDDSNSYRYHDC
jgi:hypothetical protein